MTEQVDAIVIGANIRGLVTSYVLGQLGYQTVLIERAPRVGGADASFTTPGGARFEHGLHVLDDMRSEIATRLFSHVADGEVHRHALKRGIALRGHVMPYAPKVAQMPEELRAMLPGEALVDELGDRPVTRANLEPYYGAEFVKLIFDDVLPSYPTESRHMRFGVDESELMVNIYPWFFPFAERPVKEVDESRAFHDKLRAGVEQHILYPKEGGFGGFAESFVAKLGPAVELLLSARDMTVDRDGHRINSVTVGGRTFSAPHVFWSGAWPGLCNLLELPCQDVATDRVMIGSFVLDRPARTDFHEILVGDSKIPMNRIYFPSLFVNEEPTRVQVEFAVPDRDAAFDKEEAEWKAGFVEGLHTLGILTDQKIEEFDYRSFRMHFNAFGVEGEPLIDADPGLLSADSNVRPVVPSMANLNLNRYVPRVVRQVVETLGSSRGPS